MNLFRTIAIIALSASCGAAGFYFLHDIFGARTPDVPSADIAGYWRIDDSDTGKTESVIVCYGCDGVYYCRMVAVYDSNGALTDTTEKCSQRAKGIDTHPKLCSFDFIWGLKYNGKIYDSGSVINPDSGSVYDCSAWYDASRDCLVMRGELLGFGQNQYWKKFDKGSLPSGAEVDVETLKPIIPEH